MKNPFAKRTIDEVAQAALYPHLRLETDAPGLFAEHVNRADFVFEGDGALLAGFTGSGSDLEIIFRPKTRHHPVAQLMVKHAGELKAIYAYELPEIGERANYRQVSNLPQYLFLSGIFKSAAKASGPARTGMPFWGVGLLLAMGLLSSILLFAPPRGGAQATAETKNQPTSAAMADSLGDQLTPAERGILGKVVMQSGIQLHPGEGKAFVIFSDPYCPACRELETKLAGIDKSLIPLVVPVSFKPGSSEAVAGILCSADVASAWKTVASTTQDAGPTCIKGREQAEANNAAFLALKFDMTPTIVTTTGKVAVGAKDFDGLIAWIKDNSNE